ncbi:hybrid sensor histidine kinase/response regulator transcription factor [Flavobacterium cellulosilyticum]|uniref:histidine kinase n=1 Tax=Flavobacterium cellulosilyticum TaxID=2541731 RepID=A0A4R5C8Z4_9FLAO|nr:hybrid sensor histidine kinase/response regulator transcription factor [Flavobacterium cellulosilyticum]TDD94603.1 hybrid sensor histidine kinase/response regulator [Flavobacterium cellulosilyticum]
MKILGKIFLLILIVFLLPFDVKGQQNFSFEHFLVEDGLPHNTISQIIQDKKGFIWLGTFNGLSKYDGSTFQNYKTQASDKVLMKSNRINKIIEDKFGRIWIRSDIYKTNTYCFDPKTETFWGTELIPNLSKTGFPLSKIKVNKSGLVWLLSETDGCILISDSLFTTKIYSKKQKTLSSSAVYSVHEDEQKNSWLLTDNGLTLVKFDKLSQPINYFSSQNGKTTSFYSAVELDDEVWFGGSNGQIAKYSKKGHSFRTQKIELDATITWMAKLDEQTIVALTDQKGFCTINIFTGSIRIYNSDTVKGLITNNINPIELVKNSQLWFVSNRKTGIYLFDFSEQKLYYYPPILQGLTRPTIPVVPYVFTDYKGDVWVQPYGGGFSKFNPSNHELIPFNYTDYFPNGNFTNSFITTFFDKQGNLWYSTELAGLVKVVFSENNFKTSSVTNKLIESSTKVVRSIFQDKTGNIWVGNKQNQIVVLDKNFNQIGSLSSSGQLKKNSKWNNAAYSIMQDNQSNIWIGTRGDGLYKLIPQKGEFTYKVINYKNDKSNPYSITSDDIYNVFQDKNNRIWLGTFDGLNLINTNINGETHFISYKNKWKSYPIDSFDKVRCIKQSAEGLLYVGATKGLLVFDPNKMFASSSIKKYEIGFDETHIGLNGNDVIDICITKKKEIFVATTTGGINKVVKKDAVGFPLKFKSYTKNNGLPSDNILSLLEDVDGKIWIASDYTLSRFNPNQEFFEIFHEVKGIISNYNFSEATALKLKSGELLFGYSEGILHFFSDQIKTNDFTPYLAFSNLQLFNQKVSINKDSPLNFSIDDSKELVLSHDQNFFTIEFAALDYKNPANINYAYKLEGFDKNWNYVKAHGTATYTNVPKGKYVFKVKSANSQGVWAENERQLPIIIKPSIWNSNFSYIIYVLILIGLFLLINHTLITIFRLKSNVKLEKEISNIKQKFFIDISHELRTPLTLISSPIEYLINDNRTPEAIKKQLSYIAHSSNRLQRLVNQILDFRKIQDTGIKVSEINVAAFVKNIFNDFIEVAKEKDIHFTFQNNTKETKIWADRNGFEKIIMNLLSNAFKYTPKGKSITVKITKKEKQVGIHFIDEGIGIPKENQSKLFTRFVSFSDISNNPSTGIGLSMVKELAEKHNAKLFFESEPNKGSSFSIYFKLGKEHFSNEVDFINEEEKQESESNLTLTPKLSVSDIQEKYKILVVEDEPELRSFIKSVLEDKYEVIVADDGEKGYELAIKDNPDFIISDIMMPKLSGVDLLKKIRKNIETSHIPVILLTAKANIESKLEGLSYGADDYITKPFSVSYLSARIENLLNQRKRLQNIFGVFDKNELKDFNPMPCLISDQDEEIMQRVMLLIEENIDNNNFSVEELGSKVGLNRTTFGNKIKSLTGYTPVEFIRDIRIKRAAQLIISSQLLIKEIAFMTGFSDMKYFSKSFKNKYDVTPMEYRKQNK